MRVGGFGQAGAGTGVGAGGPPAEGASPEWGPGRRGRLHPAGECGGSWEGDVVLEGVGGRPRLRVLGAEVGVRPPLPFPPALAGRTWCVAPGHGEWRPSGLGCCVGELGAGESGPRVMYRGKLTVVMGAPVQAWGWQSRLPNL